MGLRWLVFVLDLPIPVPTDGHRSSIDPDGSVMRAPREVREAELGIC